MLTFVALVTLPCLLKAVLALGSNPTCSYCAVQNLAVEPDYRAVKLSWKYLYAREPPGFKISFCEVSVWNSKLRCRQKYLPLASAVQHKWLQRQMQTPDMRYVDMLIRVERGSYQAAVYDLRMLTNYTFSVEADFNLHFTHEHPLVGDNHPHITKFGVHANNPLNVNEFNSKHYNVTVETKGFSGKTMHCLSNVSEVIVHTGPFFNGKIAVENAPDEKCAVYGNHSDPLDTYTLVIHHRACGSKVINSRIETMIIVHENKEILTHNSRRFLVVCNFPPETFTLKASVEVPRHLLKPRKKPSTIEAASQPPLRADTDRNHISSVYGEAYKVNNVRDSRILALQQEHKLVNSSLVFGGARSHLNNVMGSALFVALFASLLIAIVLHLTKSTQSTASVVCQGRQVPGITVITKEKPRALPAVYFATNKSSASLQSSFESYA